MKSTAVFMLPCTGMCCKIVVFNAVVYCPLLLMLSFLVAVAVSVLAVSAVAMENVAANAVAI